MKSCGDDNIVSQEVGLENRVIIASALITELLLPRECNLYVTHNTSF